MRVAHIIDSGGLYGAEIMLLNLCKEQLRQGIHPLVISIGSLNEQEKPIETALIQAGIEVQPWRMRPLPNLFEGWQICKFCRKNGIDLIHSHGYKGNILIGLLPKTIRKIPIISTFHGNTKSKRLSKLALYQQLDRLTAPLLEAVIAVSPATADQITKPNSKLNVQIIPNGIASPTQKYAEQHRLHTPNNKIGALGRLAYEKNFAMLIDAMQYILAVVPDATLYIYGEGPERANLELLATKLKVKNSVHLPGYTTEIESFYNSIDLFVNCSLTEGMPLSILEAMSYGREIVATDIPANRFLLENQTQPSALCNISSKDLANKIIEMLQLPDEEKLKNKQRLYDKYTREHTLSIMERHYNDIYKNVVNK